MNDLTPGYDGDMRPVFISYATRERKLALSLCEAIERRGIRSWISARDVEPGENYQEAIVRSIRDSRSVVLLFSEAANHSDEIKKELSLASRYHVPVIAFRLEHVEPSDAFAYELSTRQWIDAFDEWDNALDSLVSRIQRISGSEAATLTPATQVRRKPAFVSRRKTRLATTVFMVLLLVAAGTWWMLRPAPAAAHSMMVRLAGFQLLSSDLPPSMHEAVAAEISAAFNADGVIGVSTASAAPPGRAPAYALGGTIHRVGNSIRVITRFTNERSGAVLWSNSTDYAADQVLKVPHKVAVDSGTVIRCGLFGASTYHKALPDSVLSNYMRYCQGYWAFDAGQTLRFAQLVVAAVPDFSFGWSALANGFLQTSQLEPDSRRAENLRASGRVAEDKAIALDRANSEALAHKAYLIDQHDWASQERLFKSAIAARPLDCGCEHFGYGLTLRNVGRVGDAIDQFRAATEMLALWPDSQLRLADALVAAGRNDEAQSHFDAAVDLTTDSDLDDWIVVSNGTESGDYGTAIAALRNPQFQIDQETRAALLSGYEALAARDSRAKSRAVAALQALPEGKQGDTVTTMLAALGANREALGIATARPWLFWRRSMRGVVNDPGFPAVAQRLGLIDYWKRSRTRPDVCFAKNRPAFCRLI